MMISVLYVDDEPGLLDIGKLFLERFGDFSVSTVDSASAALEILKKEQFDAIISDYQMPGTDGLEFLKQVRHLHGQVPFILFTGRGREEVVILALNLGADYYLQKGGDPKPQFAELSHKVRLAVRRRQAEISLEESERRYRDVVETQTEFISRFRPDGTHVFANEAYCRHFKKRCDEIIGHRFVPSIPGEDRELVRSHFASFTPDHPVADIEHRVIMPDGSIRWHWWNDHAIFDDIGNVIEFQSVGKDITDRKRVEEELKQSENLYRTIFTTTGAATIIIAPDTTILLANKGWEELTGLPRSDQENKLSWTVFFDKDDADRMVRYHHSRRHDPSLAPSIYESRLIDAQKRVHPCYIYVEMIPGTKNSVASLVDITEQKHATAALAESEFRLRSFIEATRESVTLVDEDGKVIEWNPGAERISGIKKEEALGRYLWDLTFSMTPRQHRTEEHRAALEQSIRTMLWTGVPVFKEPQVVEAELPDGTRIITRQTIFPIRTDKGFRFGSMAEDITEEKRENDALRESEEKYRELTDLLPQMVFEIDLDFNITYANRQVLTVLGFSGQDLRDGINAISFIEPSQHARVKENMRKSVKGIPYEPEEYTALKKDGSRFPVIIHSSPIYHNNTLTGFRGVIIDISDRKTAEEALLRANKKLSLLTGITRHDINNQLMVLNGYVGLLQTHIPDPEYKDYFSRITKASSQIATMIRFTSEYEKIGTLSPVWQDLGNVLDRAETGILPGQVRLHNELAAGTEVYADPLIVRVFFNLLDNSLRHGQRVTEILVTSHRSEEDLVVVWEDNGVGIPAKDKERIFERGFGKNTGLGIFLAREILSLTGITIRETGDPGNGARFEMVVPKGMWREGGENGNVK